MLLQNLDTMASPFMPFVVAERWERDGVRDVGREDDGGMFDETGLGLSDSGTGQVGDWESLLEFGIRLPRVQCSTSTSKRGQTYASLLPLPPSPKRARSKEAGSVELEQNLPSRNDQKGQGSVKVIDVDTLKEFTGAGLPEIGAQSLGIHLEQPRSDRKNVSLASLPIKTTKERIEETCNEHVQFQEAVQHTQKKRELFEADVKKTIKVWLECEETHSVEGECNGVGCNQKEVGRIRERLH